MKHPHQSKFTQGKFAGFAILGGALYGLTLAPAFSQPTPTSPQNGELRPIPADAKVAPNGRLQEPRDGGPRDGGPEADGPRPPKGNGGPRDGGPRGEKGPRGEGPRHGGPRDNDGPGRGGPRERGPRGPQRAMERAYRGAGELERYGQLKGDVFNLTGQAREYYNRAGVVLKAGEEDRAEELAQTSERLTRAALHLARAENGPLPVPTVVGWAAPPAPVAPAPPEEENEPRVIEGLNRRLQDVAATPANASWIETARRLAGQAQADVKGKRLDAGRERAMAAMTLLEAAEAPKEGAVPPPPIQ